MVHYYFIKQMAQILLNYLNDKRPTKMTEKQFMLEINKIITEYITKFM